MTAVMAKEWRRFLRSPGTPWLLFVYVLLPIGVCAAYLKMLSGLQGMNPQIIPLLGAHALSVVGAWQIILVAVTAMWLSAGLLAGEAEEGTLRPLLVAGHRVIGVVLGKYLALVLFLGLMILAGLPLFSLPLLVGGVSRTLLGRVLLIEAATVVGLSGIGLLISSASRRAGGAALAGVTLALLLTLGTGLLSQIQPVIAVGNKGGQIIFQNVAMGPMGPGMQQQLTPWLYPNPIVGMNTAIGQSAMPALFGFPGAGSTVAYRGYPLWKLQAAGAGVLGLLGLLGAWLGVSLRIWWRWPLWRLRRRSRAGEVSLNG